MVIGIDANEANVSKRVGISEYAYQILTKLYEFRNKGQTTHSFEIYLKARPLDLLPKEESWWKYKIVKPQKMWTQIGLPLNLFFSKRPDVFLTLTHYAPRFSMVPTIVSVMDLSFLHFPETFKKNDLYQLTSWTKYSVLNSKRVITISESSKNDIIKFYKVPENKVRVVNMGLKEIKMDSVSKSLEEFGVTKKFILFVGTLQPRKNIVRLIQAYSILPQNIKDSHQLVIIGKKGWLYDEILETPKKYGVEESTLFLDYITDQDLPSFYKKASVYILPSLYEGFGLPILEAMRYGCPVLTSNVSSMPEAGGDAAIYFNPENTQDIEEKMEKVLTDHTLRDRMKERGLIHYKKFTWEKAAREVLSVIEEVIQK